MPRPVTVVVEQVFDCASGKCKVIGYEHSEAITVEFLKTGYTTVTTSTQLRKGVVKDRLAPSLYERGFIGEGKFTKASHPKLYSLWVDMFTRCYGKNIKSGYEDCVVVKRWANFQIFAADILKMDNWNTPGFQLDKDLRVIGNKRYGPKYCSFVPVAINGLLVDKYQRGDLAGVEEARTGGFYAGIKINGKRVRHGPFDTPEEANRSYRLLKRKYVRQMAELHKASLHPDVYYNLRNFR